MTDDEARAILKDTSGGWIDWTDAESGLDRPDWSDGTVILDGTFTADELRAILHFAPEVPKP